MSTVVQNSRELFPALRNHPEVVYFDNAATTQKPQPVLDAVLKYHHTHCANAHRGHHDWAIETTRVVEEAREKVAAFLGLSDSSGIFFTSGATASSQILARSFISRILQPNDEVVISQQEHSSLHEPWLHFNEMFKKQVAFKDVAFDPEGGYNMSSITDNLSPRTRAVVLNHIHNVFGIEMGIKEARQVVSSEIPIILDATQSFGHTDLSVPDLGVQALYFSAHKAYGLSGIGVLWIDPQYIHDDYSELEKGTLNLEGVVSLGAAIDFISSVGLPAIEQHLLDLTQYTLQQLRSVPGIESLPGPALHAHAIGHGILSFRKEGVASIDLAQWLNENGFYVRAGDYCTSASESVTNSVRLSFQIYNTREEIDRFITIMRDM